MLFVRSSLAVLLALACTAAAAPVSHSSPLKKPTECFATSKPGDVHALDDINLKEKTVLCPGGIGSCIDLEYLPEIGYEYVETDDQRSCEDTYDKGCSGVIGAGKNYHVTYSDGIEQDFCMCPNGVYPNLDDVISTAAIMPQPFRQAAKSIKIQGPTDPGANGAWTYGNRMTLLGGGMNYFKAVLIHESAHAWDWEARSGYLSLGPEWAAAVNADTCVPDPYSQSSLIELFAQVLVEYIADIQNEDTWNNRLGADCMKNMRDFVIANFPLKPPGGGDNPGNPGSGGECEDPNAVWNGTACDCKAGFEWSDDGKCVASQ
ncbi:uncharacterized protein EV422DRAFT_622935 [Fimicolochytrium jonesii]|uniref:uncharacterized protein n=1 Tax=Fimicolochytrium jonesii TaxID=1396493 RepID=UPI0022FEFE68|nr:uncharacterized protein EV422DRAFT_622935 [Fimicolochytrium jonesii]KAI8817056.1 hypothetical protein EV422DRAFT_622935 [Fimicolochytrium jonesii]